MANIVPYEQQSITVDAALIEPEPLTQDDYLGICQVFAQRNQAHWLLLTRILRATGLRESEVLRLMPEHIERNGPATHLLVIRGKKRRKTGKEPVYERVLLQPDVAMHLTSYIGGHRTQRGFPIFHHGARAFQYAFNKASIDATGTDHHPHELRGLYADELLDKGIPVAVVAQQLGHVDGGKTLAQHYMKRHRGRRNQINAMVQA